MWLGDELFGVSEQYVCIKINDMDSTTLTNVQDDDSISSSAK
jgi:hypothetical protein